MSMYRHLHCNESYAPRTCESYDSCAGRGKPDEIISDNSPRFKMVKNAVDLAWENVAKVPDVISCVSERLINWSFIIIEFSPWIGGF